MDGTPRAITDADERRAVRRQAVRVVVKSAAVTAIAAAGLALI